MKIVSWNCNGALRKKLDKLLTIEADAYVIQECEDPARTSDKRYKEWASNYLWRGSNKNKGLGVFAKQGDDLDLLPLDGEGLESFIACRVNCRHTLLAVWTREANSPTFKYIGQLWKYLQRHKEYLAKVNPWVIGDLNSNACWDVWDRWWNHSDVVRELDEIGIRSLYHHHFRQEQGKESQPTFFLYRRQDRAYHIDYAFLPADLLEVARLSVGSPAEWLEFSDHMPILVEVTDRRQIAPELGALCDPLPQQS